MKKGILMMMLIAMLFLLSGCLIQPDPTLDPLVITDGVMPFGTVQPLPTDTPEPTMVPEVTSAPETWQSSDQSTWEVWAELPTSTPRVAATVAPDMQSWETSTRDYYAGYPVLRLGSLGSDVSDMQARLAELGYYNGDVDGRYTSETQTAVQEFQTRNNMTADGIAGRQVQDVLYSSSAVPKYLTATADGEGYVLLKQGAFGVEVRKLQGRLAELGYYAGGVDGIYSTTTVSAVKAFQRANGLTGDGQAGEQTQKKLYSASAKYASSPVTTADPGEVRSLTVGMTGNDVYALQARLVELRYLDGVADGVFGEETKQALMAFQQNNGIHADGEAGSTTLRKLAGNCKAANRTATTDTTTTSSVLREGDEGESVYVLQALLFELGYYTGRIDGRFTAETTQAVMNFQRNNGLAADGVAGKETLRALNSNDALPAERVENVSETESVQTWEAVTPSLSVLRKGDRSAEVMVMQQYLANLGYLSTEPDGQFGSGTERAVKLFQEANGLTADGIAGKGTLAILYGNDAVAYDERFGTSGSRTESPAVTQAPNTNIVIQWESTGDDVRQYQIRLAELGYLSNKDITGTFNQKTVDATKAFQRMNGLKVDGAAGPQSLKLIYSEDARNADGLRVGDIMGMLEQSDMLFFDD